MIEDSPRKGEQNITFPKIKAKKIDKMEKYYKQSPKWRKLNKLDIECKIVAKNHNKFNDYISRLENAIKQGIIDESDEEDTKVRPPDNDSPLGEQSQKKLSNSPKKLLNMNRTRNNFSPDLLF